MNRDLTSLSDWTPDQVLGVLTLAEDLKKNPEAYQSRLAQQTLLMIFEKPSLRTRVSFETGMTQLGGHAIYYDMSTSPMGAGKESIADTAQVVSRYVDIIMARLHEHSALVELAEFASVPVVNALTNDSHPCQILADLLTIREHRGTLTGKTLSFFGDGFNNVTHSLMVGGAMMGMHVRVACPEGADYMPASTVVDQANLYANASGGSMTVTHDVFEAADQADVLYTDSWMSYHIDPALKKERVKRFMPYQVRQELLDAASDDAIFMNCLPAERGYEQTSEVIDGPSSVVFDQAENRLHAQKAVMLTLLEKV